MTKKYQRRPLHSLSPTDETTVPNWLFTINLPQDEMLAYVLLTRIAQDYPDGVINDLKGAILERALTLVVWDKHQYATFPQHVEHVIRMLRAYGLIDIDSDWQTGEEAWAIHFEEANPKRIGMVKTVTELDVVQADVSPDGDRREEES